MTNAKITPTDLAKQVRKDLKSSQGRRAVEDAVVSSSQINRKLSEDSWLDPKKLDEPITD